jgi:nucleoside-diphosphate-sugar epimerase
MRGCDVIVFDRAQPYFADKSLGMKFVQDDIRNLQALSYTFSDADLIFHLAGILGTEELFDDPKQAIDINIGGALNVLLASKGKPRRVFLPAKPNHWNNIYSVTSQAVEKLGCAYRDNFGLDVRLLQFQNVYGPGQKLFPVRKAVPFFIFRALENQPIEIFGDGSQIMELLHIADAAKIIVEFMLYDGDLAGLYEVRTPARPTVSAVAQMVALMAGSKSTITYRPKRLGECPETTFSDKSNIEGVLGALSI